MSNYITLHNIETGNEIIVFVNNIFAIECNIIFGAFPDNRLIVKEDEYEILRMIGDCERRGETE